MSDTPKTFVVLFLLLLYVSVNDKGATARLDYAGMNRNVNPGVIAGYAIASVLLFAAAHAWSRRSVAA